MLSNEFKKMREGVQGMADLITTTANDAVHEVADIATQTATELRDAMDATVQEARNTLPSVEDLLVQAASLPGVRVDRAEFLRSALQKYPDDVIHKALVWTPIHAGIPLSKLWRMAGKALGKEARRTTVVSAAAGLPGVAVAAATIPADMIQLYGHLLRAIQMLSYLYGWRDACRLPEGDMDTAAKRVLVLFLGVMAGDERADAELVSLSAYRDADGVREAACTNDAADAVARRLEERMAHRMTGQVVGKSIPLAGAVISGTMQYGGFSDMWKRLRQKLAEIG